VLNFVNIVVIWNGDRIHHVHVLFLYHVLTFSFRYLFVTIVSWMVEASARLPSSDRRPVDKVRQIRPDLLAEMGWY
jgi:hypothetical protein